jgi:hypothetical protein
VFLYALYLIAIKQYVSPESVVLEIGPGRGAFTKAILKHDPKEVWCLDAVSAEENSFFEYIGKNQKVKYSRLRIFPAPCCPKIILITSFLLGRFVMYHLQVLQNTLPIFIQT